MKSTTADWSKCSPAQILADINSLLTREWESTNERHWPERLLLPRKTVRLLTTHHIRSEEGRSVLQWLMDNVISFSATGRRLTIESSNHLSSNEIETS